MDICSEIRKLESENIKLRKENGKMSAALMKANENLRILGLKNRKLKHDNERFKNRINFLQNTIKG